MKQNPISSALLFSLLAACSGQHAPVQATSSAQPEAAAPDLPATSTTVSQEKAMGKRAAGDGSPPMAVFRAFGTEPFWNINVEDATLTLTTPDDQQGVVMQGERRSLPDGAEISGIHDGTPFALKVTTGACSDGMSDNKFRLVSTFRHGEVDYKGCGEAAK